MIGTGANPNLAACIVIGIEPHWTQKVVEGIAATGKPVAGFWIEGNGDSAGGLTTIAEKALGNQRVDRRLVARRRCEPGAQGTPPGARGRGDR